MSLTKGTFYKGDTLFLSPLYRGHFIKAILIFLLYYFFLFIVLNKILWGGKKVKNQKEITKVIIEYGKENLKNIVSNILEKYIEKEYEK